MIDAETGQHVAAVLGVIVALALAIGTTIGGLVTYLTEAVKATGAVPDGYSGIVAIVLSTTLCVTLTSLTKLTVDDMPNWGAIVLLGVFAGLVTAANSVRSFKAMASVNEMPAYTEGLANGRDDSSGLKIAKAPVD